MCIEKYIVCKPLFEQMVMETIYCQMAKSMGNKSNLVSHYQNLLKIEKKCKKISGIDYEYHNLIEEKIKGEVI